MENGIVPVNAGSHPAASAAPRGRTARLYAVPDGPPAYLRQELDTAARVIEELSAKQVNLHLEVEDGTVRVQVRDASGTVLREIPPRSLFDTLAGAGLLVDQKG